MLGDKYKIEVSFPGSGLTLTYPTNASFEWGWEKEQGQIYYRRKLNTNLFFRDNADLQGQDFGKLYAIERSRQSRCDKVDVIVYKRCNKTDAWTQHYNGYLSMIDGKWDVSHCEVEIPIRPQDQYTCLYENWEKEINILSLPGLERFESRSTIGVIEYKQCTRTTFTQRYDNPSIGASACLGVPPIGGPLSPPSKAWTLVKHRITIGTMVQTTWAREVFIGAKPGPDWEDDGGKWVRTVVPEEDLTQSVDNGFEFQQAWNVVEYTITNGVKLSALLPEMIKSLSTCQYTLKSNFFGIAPDNTAPINQAYGRAGSHMINLYVYDKSDVRRAKDKDQSASGVKNLISMKKMLENLKVLFNLAFVIEPDTNVMRLEHVSYFGQKRMLDLTQERFLPDIAASWKYAYQKTSLPITEKFEFMDVQRRLMDGLPIEYNYTCSNDDKATNEVTFKADSVSTDVDDMVYHPDKYSDKGFVFVERATAGYIVSGIGYGLAVVRNGNLSWTSLQDPFYKWDRPQSRGNMNGNETNFHSFKRTRKQVPIQIQLCCSDFDTFDPLDLVKTQLGWGEIVSAKYGEPQEVMTLELIHD